MKIQSICPRVICASLMLLCAAPLARGEGEQLKSGIDRANLDPSIKPGDDFFQYVNGGWLKNNPIPPEYTRWGAFAQLHDDNLVQLRQILEELAHAQGPLDPNQRKIRDIYLSAMDEAQLDKQGAAPLAGELERIAKVSTPAQLVDQLAHMRAMGLPALFGFSIGQDAKNSSMYAAHLRQGGLSLPERSYYLGESADAKKLLGQYREHVEKMLSLLGDSPEAASAGADAVLRIETELAKSSRTPVQLRDREANYNKKSIKELAELTPAVDWPAYLKGIDVEGVNDVIVGQPEFMKAAGEMLQSIPAKDWQAYLRWHLVHNAAPYLSSAFEKENFHFFSETLRGAKEMPPRWKRAVNLVDRLMGQALGKLYVDKHFPPAAKHRMDQLVANILEVYRDRILSRGWMGPETKQQALAKLAAVTPKIGYPDKWRDYSALETTPDSCIGNVLRAEAFESRFRLARMGQPVDRTEWGMTTPTVNAYYNSSLNEIVFPAGILQPPFFDAAADDAVNYGAIGAVIGHEITHGFDDQGSRSDGAGNLRNWWTADDRGHFTALTDRLVKQYDDCVVVDDVHVNGKLTLGENLADLGGVNIAYMAWQKSLGGKASPVIDGFTGPQRFFIGFGQVWRGAARDADQRLLIRTDPHSPSRFRALVPLSNVDAFYEAFGLKPGDKMYREPADRLVVW